MYRMQSIQSLSSLFHSSLRDHFFPCQMCACHLVMIFISFGFAFRAESHNSPTEQTQTQTQTPHQQQQYNSSGSNSQRIQTTTAHTAFMPLFRLSADGTFVFQYMSTAFHAHFHAIFFSLTLPLSLSSFFRLLRLRLLCDHMHSLPCFITLTLTLNEILCVLY